ncbi:DUF1445 domain protein [Aspergillus stella-maris]|uniref:DUF1445 domain protein n=1 Tax=Aspergillus stella-maris TaxID=1810926 RepID=UPI003CCE2B08
MGSIAHPLQTAHDVRLASRKGQHTAPTAGLAPGYIQANLIVLPSRYAADFRALCQRNPVPCPLVAESAEPATTLLSKDKGVDIRTDIPRYMVYLDGKAISTGCPDLLESWTEDHIAFLIGCSFSFETALIADGLTPAHIIGNSNVPMYRTTRALDPAGVFTGSSYVVSMRAYKARDVPRVREITERYAHTHGGPVDWGWGALKRLGVKDINVPEWGDRPLGLDGEELVVPSFDDSEKEEEDGDTVVPVFWGCGVTPQEAVTQAKLEGTVMAHLPGHMLVLDCLDGELMV